MQKQPSASEVSRIIDDAAACMGTGVQNAEIAFFGGSFTAIDHEYMLSLLKAADLAVKKYGFMGVRCSTRPDAVSSEILSLLKAYSVTSIELGAQSMNDRVLFMNDRGHTASHVREASALIKSFGFELGLQMMTGLYGSSRENDVQTARELIDLCPDTVRIYPTVTLENTRLAELYRSGEYVPPALEDSVELCSELIDMFEENGIRVIRVGLHSSEEMSERVAGPYHPAFRELCTSLSLFRKITVEMNKAEASVFTVVVSPKLVSPVIGQKKSNIMKWKKLGYEVRVCQNDSIEGFRIIPEKN